VSIIQQKRSIEMLPPGPEYLRDILRRGAQPSGMTPQPLNGPITGLQLILPSLQHFIQLPKLNLLVVVLLLELLLFRTEFLDFLEELVVGLFAEVGELPDLLDREVEVLAQEQLLRGGLVGVGGVAALEKGGELLVLLENAGQLGL
jgi:hypothetical protein